MNDELQAWIEDVIEQLSRSGIEWGDVYYTITDEADRERTLNGVPSGVADFWVRKDNAWVLFVGDEQAGTWEAEVFAD